MATRHDSSPSDPHAPAADSLGAATKGLTDALLALNKVIGEQVSGVVPELQDTLAASLRQASASLNNAAARTQADAQTKRARKIDQTRADLLDAAARVFADKGYEGASMGDIGTEAGFTKGALYAHFKSKAELFYEVVRTTVATVADSPTTIPGVNGRTIDEAEITSWLQRSADDPRLLLSLEFIAYGIRHPESRDEFSRLQQCSFEGYAEDICRIRLVREGKSPTDQEIHPDQADRDTALTIVSLANYVTLQARLSGATHASPASAARVIAATIVANDR